MNYLTPVIDSAQQLLHIPFPLIMGPLPQEHIGLAPPLPCVEVATTNWAPQLQQNLAPCLLSAPQFPHLIIILTLIIQLFVPS